MNIESGYETQTMNASKFQEISKYKRKHQPRKCSECQPLASVLVKPEKNGSMGGDIMFLIDNFDILFKSWTCETKNSEKRSAILYERVFFFNLLFFYFTFCEL